MRFICLLIGLLATAPLAYSQGSLGPAQLTAIAPPPTAADTAAAIHRLFAAQRRASAAVIGTTVGGGLLCAGLAEATRHTYTIEATPLIATALSLLSIPATAAELLFFRQFTRRKEQRAVEAWQQHRLKPRIRRQLKPRFFHPNP